MKIQRIDYKGGYLWVDKSKYTPVIKKGQLYWRTIHNSIDTCIHDNQVFENEYPIVGQTNLSIPNVLYVEFEEGNSLDKAKRFVVSHLELTMKNHMNGGYIPNDVLLSLVNVSVEAGYKFGSKSKGKYSEDDINLIKDAISMSFPNSNDVEDYKQWLTRLKEWLDKFIKQPPLEIEIETKQVCGDISCLRMSLNGENSTCCGDSIITVPITYERDGKTYLKVKQ
jgi:hypothetical protein